MTDHHHHDRDTVVVRDGGRSTGLGTILGIIVILALLAAVWYITLGPGAGTTTNGGGGDTNTAPSMAAPTDAPAGS